MDQRFLAQLEATRIAVERATAGIDLSQLTIAAEAAQRLTSTVGSRDLVSARGKRVGAPTV